MLHLALKKIFNNKLLMLSLFAGMLIAVLIACTIPIYANAISHRMFVTQMELYQDEKGISPAAVSINCPLSSFKQQIVDEAGKPVTVGTEDSRASIKNYRYATDYFEKNVYPHLNMPELARSITLSTATLYAGDVRDRLKNSVQPVVLRACDSYENAFELIEGKMATGVYDEDGCIEVVMSEASQQKLHLTLGTILQVSRSEGGVLNDASYCDLKIKIVGLVAYKQDSLNPIRVADTGVELYGDFDLFYSDLLVEQNLISKAAWYYSGDFTQFDLNRLGDTLQNLENLNKNMAVWGLSANASTYVPPIEEYRSYEADVNSVNILLTFFYAPILLLILFFIFMISKFLVEHDKSEIAMLNSRGASTVQILLLYLYQAGILALAALLIAPFLAVLLCDLLGTTSGFLEFSQRAPILVRFSFVSLLFALLAAVVSVITILIPVFFAAKKEVVQRKNQKRSRVVLIQVILAVCALLCYVVTVYAYYVLVGQKGGLLTASGRIQPLAYLLLTFFFVAVSLTFILLYPLILKLMIRLFGKKWDAGRFSAFSRIASLQSRERFMVIFLTMTIALGVFSSVSARTLNFNLDRSTQYQYPCDLIADVTFYSDGTQVKRPYFYDTLEKTQATKVIVGNEPAVSSIYGADLHSDVRLMGIDPFAFESIIHWDDTILPEKMNYYCNLVAEGKCILSTETAKALGNLSVGDTVNIYPNTSDDVYEMDLSWFGNDNRANRFRYFGGMPAKSIAVSCTVGAIVDTWPTYYASSKNANGITKTQYLVVVGSDRIEERMNNEAYQIWMNTELNYNEIRRFTIQNYARLTNVKNGTLQNYLCTINAVRQATNGSLTLGFIAVLVVCLIGFFIYWVMSVKSREVQIGTMRALGMSLREIYQMILHENILLSVASVVLGIAAGVLSGVLFAPLLQSAFTQMGNYPPYQVTFNVFDLIKLIVLIALLLTAGVLTAFRMLKNIKAASAIKLGED